MAANSAALAKFNVECSTLPLRGRLTKSARNSFSYILVLVDKAPQKGLKYSSCTACRQLFFFPSLMHQQDSGFLIGQTKWMSKLGQSTAVLLKP